MKSFLALYRSLFRRLTCSRSLNRARASTTLASHDRYSQGCPSPEALSGRTLVVDVEGGLLRSTSTFPYFMLVAFEAGSLPRALLLLVLYPLVWCLGSEAGIRVMVMACFCGLKEEEFRAGRSVLPKWFMEDVGLEGFEVLRRGGRRVCVSRLPRVMVEGFLKEYLEVEVVVGRELRVVGGFYTGFMEEVEEEEEEEEEEGERVAEEVVGGEEGVGRDVIGFGSYAKALESQFFSYCKEIYTVTESEKQKWHPLPRSRYPKALVFHDGRLAFLPTPLSASLVLLLWLPFSLPLSLFRNLLFTLLPTRLAVPLAALSGVLSRHHHPHNASPRPQRYHLYVCNHRTLIDPVYVSVAIGSPVSAVTYSVSPVSEALSPLRCVRLTRDKAHDRARMAQLLAEGNLVVCPEGTTCREPYLLRFSPLFAELADEIVPVAIATRVQAFHGTTATGFKCLDSFYFMMNPWPAYEMWFLDKMPTRAVADEDRGSSSCEVANRVQRVIGAVLGFDCTSLSRKDKYLMLAGNDGTVQKKKKKRTDK